MNRPIFLGILLLAARDAAAQRIAPQRMTVQQPVVENFSVATTVSVPDRGSALLGGVGSAASGRYSAGPLRSGSSFGLTWQNSSASVHVFIHDFEAMDEALLATPTSASTSRLDPRITSRLQQTRRAESSPAAPVNLTVDAARAERLAEQAEARGKFAVAKLHWQRAARHGSQRAAQRLDAPALAAETK